ncbi:MAG: carbamoyltransferase HypF, partial [Candidatus Omnitrophica bacterium]|nr:carbamoyltransferase HypF [Candidatus Omnitrophota bacterium]
MTITTIKKQTKLKKLRTPNQKRLRIIVTGAVQGVGFRPFIYRLATELELFGWVKNSTQGVLIEVEGEHLKLEDFLYRIEREKPPRASIQSLESVYLDAAGYQDFQILESKLIGEKSAFVLPDIATCPECLSDIFNPLNRRFRYPFTNCTHCGPRFSIIRALPYDRERTSMAGFKMCQDCAREYRDPKNRRFHAEPNACPVCGPHLELWNPEGKVLAAHDRALFETVAAICDGKVVAIKGLGGFHLMADARNGKIIQRLRTRKHREEKPFAVMFPNLESVKECCDISKTEERLLTSVESPIVILHQKSGVSELLA